MTLIASLPSIHDEPLPSRVNRIGARVLRALPLALLLLGVAVLYGRNLNGYPEYINDDEGTYYAQAWAVLHEHVMAHYTYWYDHPPVGWIQMAALLKPLGLLFDAPSPGEPIEVAGRACMTIVMVVATALVYKLGRNLGLPKVVSLAAGALWVLSPLTIFYGRQIFLDNIDTVWLLAAFVLVTGKPKLHLYVLGGFAFAMCVLSKETAAVALPALIVAIFTFSWRRTRSFALVGFMGAFLLAVSGYLLFAIVKHEVFPGAGHVSLWWAIEWQLKDRGSSGFIFTNNTGANQLLDVWVGHDKYLLLAGAVALPFALFLRRSRAIALVPLAYLLVAMKPGYLPAMYVITPMPFVALTVAFVVWKAWQSTSLTAVRSLMVTGRIALLALVAVGITIVSPTWSAEAHKAMTVDQNGPYEQALRFVQANLPRDTTILTDDNTWNDLVAMGWSGDGWHGPIWHFKLDKDPVAQKENLPGGWKDVDYILTGRAMEVFVGGDVLSAKNSPQVNAALAHSSLVNAWGPVGLQVRLLKVDPNLPAVDPGTMRTDLNARRAGIGDAPAPALTQPAGDAPAATPAPAVSAATVQTQVNDLVKQFALSVDDAERARLLAQIQELAKTPGVTVPYK